MDLMDAHSVSHSIIPASQNESMTKNVDFYGLFIPEN